MTDTSPMKTILLIRREFLKLTCREKVFFCICLGRKTQPSSVEVIVDRAEDLFIRTRPRIPIPNLIRRTGSISTVWCWSGVWSRPSCWTSGLRPRFPPGWVCGKFYVSSSLHETCRSSFWTVSGWSHWCSITASSDWYLVFWFPSEKRKLFEKYFYFNLLKNSCIKTQATSFSYIIRKLQNFETSVPTQSAVWQMQR